MKYSLFIFIDIKTNFKCQAIVRILLNFFILCFETHEMIRITDL